MVRTPERKSDIRTVSEGILLLVLSYAWLENCLGEKVLMGVQQNLGLGGKSRLGIFIHEKRCSHDQNNFCSMLVGRRLDSWIVRLNGVSVGSVCDHEESGTYFGRDDQTQSLVSGGRALCSTPSVGNSP